MRYLSMFSGIEAASVAWEPLGWEPAAFCEIEPFPSAVLAHHWPHVPNLGDVTKANFDDVGPIDLAVFGSPCQSFSVAGKRLGLDDPRGNLALYALGVVERLRPRWFLFENVPGLLSSGEGRDFGAFLGTVGDIGYQCAWRTLDAQYFGVPQRRRRVFVVGYLGDWRRAAAVLFERHSLSGHPAPRREKGQATAGTLKACDGAEEADRLVFSGQSLGCDPHLAPTLDTGAEHHNRGIHVAHSLRAEGFDASEEGTGRGTPLVPVAAIQSVNMPRDKKQNGLGIRDDEQMFTLTARDQHAVAFDMRGRDDGAQMEGPHDTANIRASSGGSSRSYIAFAENSRAELRLCGGDGNVSAQLTTGGGKPGQGQPCIADTLTSNGDAHSGYRDEKGLVHHASAVRRLTPRECEALQGFPPDFTLVPYRGKPAADGPRYKALGNSMAVPVVRWIGERIEAVEAVCSQAEAA